MAKALYDGVSGVARKVKKKYDGVSGVAQAVKKAYDGVGGVARQFWSSGTPLSSLAVGSTVYMKVNGVSKAFIVVNRGRPSSAYDSSCDGTWLLMKNLHEKRAWDATNNDYANSDIHAYLNSTFLGLFDSGVQSAIKQVKIPYRAGSGTSKTVSSGSSGLSTKVFLLSYTEVGFSGSSSAPVEGAVLDYFDGAANSDRIAYLNGTATGWWLRSPFTGLTTSACYVGTSGADFSVNVTLSYGVRPCIILPSTQTVDDSFNVIA